MFKLTNNLLIELRATSNKCSLISNLSTLRERKSQSNNELVISCKRKNYDFYRQQTYKKFEEIPLASKGWTHNKSKGDYFTIHPNAQDIDQPTVDFAEVGIIPELQQVLRNEGIQNLTYFQSNVIPAIKEQKHTLLAAETGCGKTLAYLIPIIHNLSRSKTDELNMPKALVLVPNRELAHQIEAVARRLCQAVGLKTNVLVGGRTKQILLNPEFDDVDILITTPGIISKFATLGVYKLQDVEYTVLDEADTLLDDSFSERMESLLRRMAKTQFTIVGATLPTKLPASFEPIMPRLVQIKSERLHKPLLNVKQRFLRLILSARPSQLLKLTSQAADPVICFTNRATTCNWLAMFLRENGVKCANINGDMNYALRIEQWNKFVSRECNVLSATDVGSRGLNTINVGHVINYDFPLYAADYIHRVGRTGRLGGPEFTQITNFICSEQEVKLVQQIEMAIRTNAEITKR